METNNLQCSGAIEWLNDKNLVTKRVKYTLMTVQILRNEFRELVLSIQNGKAVAHKFSINESVTIHKKFIMEGKATINITHEKVVVLMSNAPSAHLIPFLKTLFIKIASKKQSPKVKLREQLLSGKAHVLEDISPVNSKDMSRIRNDIEAQKKTLTQLELKRKRVMEKERETQQNSKKQRLLSLIKNFKLTAEQEEVLAAATSKHNIFFTGSAGTGKSHLLRVIINALPPNETVATASTGAAACLIGGITLHSFVGIGGGNVSVNRAIELASRQAVVWRRCKYLIVDEISMINGDYFELIENVARAVRRSKEPFGGIKLILCGDFLQLPPVCRNGKAKFCFQTEAWSRCKFVCFNLKQVHRQKDNSFISILNSIRVGRVTEEISERLKSTSKNVLEKEGIVPTRLCCRTVEAQTINDYELRQLQGEEYKYIAKDNGDEKVLDDHTPVVKTLILKQGAQVMLLKNRDISSGLVNGARGIVCSFKNGKPEVQFRSGVKCVIEPVKWIVKRTDNILVREQVPLRLAWAFSIHKSQGLTLDCVEMSLSRVFEAGQAYVALSRAQSLEALRIQDFDAKEVWADAEVLKFYKQLDFNMNALKLRPLGKPL